MNYPALGKRIRQRRLAMHLTQANLAERVDISASYLGHLERGTRVMSLETLLGLCRALGTTPNDLLAMELLSPSDDATDDLSTRARELLQAAIDLLRS